MAERIKKHSCTSPNDFLRKQVKFIGHRVVIHMASGAKLIGTLTKITPAKTLLMNDALKERVNGTTTVLGTFEVPHTEITLVCRFSKCQCGEPVQTQGRKSPNTLIHMGESSKMQSCTPPKYTLSQLAQFSGHRVVVHKSSGSKLLGTLCKITPTRSLLMTDTLKERVDGTTTVLGTFEVPYTEITLVCRFSKCQCVKRLVAEKEEPMETGGGYALEVEDEEACEFDDSDRLYLAEAEETHDTDDQ